MQSVKDEQKTAQQTDKNEVSSISEKMNNGQSKQSLKDETIVKESTTKVLSKTDSDNQLKSDEVTPKKTKKV